MNVHPCRCVALRFFFCLVCRLLDTSLCARIFILAWMCSCQVFRRSANPFWMPSHRESSPRNQACWLWVPSWTRTFGPRAPFLDVFIEACAFLCLEPMVWVATCRPVSREDFLSVAIGLHAGAPWRPGGRLEKFPGKYQRWLVFSGQRASDRLSSHCFAHGPSQQL